MLVHEEVRRANPVSSGVSRWALFSMMTTHILVAFTLLGSVFSSSTQQPLEPLIKFRTFQEHDTLARLERSDIFFACQGRRIEKLRMVASVLAPMCTTPKLTQWASWITCEAHWLFVVDWCRQDCTTAANPEGVSDREWCYVEVFELSHIDDCSRMYASWVFLFQGAGRQCGSTEMGNPLPSLLAEIHVK